MDCIFVETAWAKYKWGKYSQKTAEEDVSLAIDVQVQ